MLFHLAGIFLVALHTADSQGETQGLQSLAQIWASLGDTIEILCRCPTGMLLSTVKWYKEEQDQTLSKIYESSRYSIPRERYSGTFAQEIFNLSIRDLQRNDSGVYYCFAEIGPDFKIINGSRVIVAGGTKPTPNILVPSSLQGAPLNQSSPLLCVIWGAHPAWAPVSWTISGVDSPDPWAGDTMDRGGVFGLWSLQLVPPDSWNKGTSYTCSVRSRNNSATFWMGDESTDTGNCSHILYLGVPCVLTILLVTLLVLLLRKMPPRGWNAEQPETQMPTSGISETEYAALGCRQ